MLDRKSLYIWSAFIVLTLSIDPLWAYLERTGLVSAGRFHIATSVIQSGVLAVCSTLYIKHQRAKRFGPFIKEELTKLGYKMLGERPLSALETFEYRQMTPTLYFSGFFLSVLSALRYRSVNDRILHVINQHEVELELHVRIKTHHRGKLELQIEKKTRLSP